MEGADIFCHVPEGVRVLGKLLCVVKGGLAALAVPNKIEHSDLFVLVHAGNRAEAAAEHVNTAQIVDIHAAVFRISVLFPLLRILRAFRSGARSRYAGCSGRTRRQKQCDNAHKHRQCFLHKNLLYNIRFPRNKYNLVFI